MPEGTPHRGPCSPACGNLPPPHATGLCSFLKPTWPWRLQETGSPRDGIPAPEICSAEVRLPGAPGPTPVSTHRLPGRPGHSPCQVEPPACPPLSCTVLRCPALSLQGRRRPLPLGLQGPTPGQGRSFYSKGEKEVL